MSQFMENLPRIRDMKVEYDGEAMAWRVSTKDDRRTGTISSSFFDSLPNAFSHLFNGGTILIRHSPSIGGCFVVKKDYVVSATYIEKWLLHEFDTIAETGELRTTPSRLAEKIFERFFL